MKARGKKKKFVGSDEATGIALGVIGLSLRDFESLTPEEFAAVYAKHTEGQHDGVKDAWERMRLLAAITIRPHIKKKISPKELIPFPWDSKAQGTGHREPISDEERKRRLTERKKQAGW